LPRTGCHRAYCYPAAMTLLCLQRTLSVTLVFSFSFLVVRKQLLFKHHHPDGNKRLQLYLRNDGVWTGCGRQQCTPDRPARNDTVESLIPSSFPTVTLSVQPANRQGQRCMQLLSDVLTLDWVDRLD